MCVCVYVYIYIYTYICTHMICIGLSNEHSGPALNQQLGWLALDRLGSFAWNGNYGILSTLDPINLKPSKPYKPYKP